MREENWVNRSKTGFSYIQGFFGPGFFVHTVNGPLVRLPWTEGTTRGKGRTKLEAL